MGPIKIDKDDLKDLKQAIGDSRKQSLADALAVFAGRAKSVVDFAENKIAQFEQGYFAAKLGGTTGRDMRALETVAQGFGVSAEAMRSSTQALHRNEMCIRDSLSTMRISRRMPRLGRNMSQSSSLHYRTFLLLLVIVSIAFGWLLWPFYGCLLYTSRCV